jgi:hypothetical protein
VSEFRSSVGRDRTAIGALRTPIGGDRTSDRPHRGFYGAQGSFYGAQWKFYGFRSATDLAQRTFYLPQTAVWGAQWKFYGFQSAPDLAQRTFYLPQSAVYGAQWASIRGLVDRQRGPESRASTAIRSRSWGWHDVAGSCPERHANAVHKARDRVLLGRGLDRQIVGPGDQTAKVEEETVDEKRPYLLAPL